MPADLGYDAGLHVTRNASGDDQDDRPDKEGYLRG
jgi:hypothetical protein